MTLKLESLQLDTRDQPDAAVIWLHGLGADGNDFAPIIPQLQLPDTLGIRFIFPHAPMRPITINQGYEMPGWYDVASLDIVGREDRQGIDASSQAIAQLCNHQQTLGIAADRIIIAGFSQGGAIALNCGLQYPHTLAGIMALSTYLPHSTDLDSETTVANRGLNIFMAHGNQDEVVAPEFGRTSCEKLNAAGYAVQWHDYVMGHSVCMEEIQDIRRWLIERLA